MRKIPTLFVRNSEDRRYVTDEVTPGCEWVLAGEGIATRKYDGTCVMLDDEGLWWARREVKRGKEEPSDFWAVEHDETTEKTVGWEPISQSGFYKFWQEAVASKVWVDRHGVLRDALGTYELVGPKINSNPEKLESHHLIRHEDAELLGLASFPVSAINAARVAGWEGIVWHHPDGRMAKLKVRDYPPLH